jgi:hypothetical protein
MMKKMLATVSARRPCLFRSMEWHWGEPAENPVGPGGVPVKIGQATGQETVTREGAPPSPMIMTLSWVSVMSHSYPDPSRMLSLSWAQPTLVLGR